MKIKITNERLWDIQQNGEDIDQWLKDNIGIGGWVEYFGVYNVPYRCFEFKKEKDTMLFILRWL